MICSADLLSKKIVANVMAKDYINLEKIMSDVFRQEERLLVLAQISNMLPSVAFEVFFLNGLKFIVRLGGGDYKKMVALCAGRDIALYNIARFLIVHGGAQKEFINEIGLNSEWSKVRGVIDFSKNKEVILSSDFEGVNEKLYAFYGICLQDLSRLKKKLAREML